MLEPKGCKMRMSSRKLYKLIIANWTSQAWTLNWKSKLQHLFLTWYDMHGGSYPVAMTFDRSRLKVLAVWIQIHMWNSQALHLQCSKLSVCLFSFPGWWLERHTVHPPITLQKDTRTNAVKCANHAHQRWQTKTMRHNQPTLFYQVPSTLSLSLSSNLYGHVQSYGIYTDTRTHTHIRDGLSKCLCLVWLINRNSMRAASCLVLKTVTCLNNLKHCILSFMFETAAKTCRKCYVIYTYTCT